jgi:hypothetical protein
VGSGFLSLKSSSDLCGEDTPKHESHQGHTQAESESCPQTCDLVDVELVGSHDYIIQDSLS